MPGWREVQQSRWGSGGGGREQGARDEAGQRSGLSHLTHVSFQGCYTSEVHGDSAFPTEMRRHKSDRKDSDWKLGQRWRKRGRLRCKVGKSSICSELREFSRLMLPCLRSLTGLLSEYKPGLEILESSWQNMQPDYNGGSSIAAWNI